MFIKKEYKQIKNVIFLITIFCGVSSLQLCASETAARSKDEKERRVLSCITEENTPVKRIGNLVSTQTNGVALDMQKTFLCIPKLPITPHSQSQVKDKSPTRSERPMTPISPRETEKRPAITVESSPVLNNTDSKTSMLDVVANTIINQCNYSPSKIKDFIYKINPTLDPMIDSHKEKLIQLTYRHIVRPTLEDTLKQKCPKYATHKGDLKEIETQINNDITIYLETKKTPNTPASFLYNAIIDLWYPTFAEQCYSCCCSLLCCMGRKNNADYQVSDEVESSDETKLSKSNPKDASARSKSSAKEIKKT